MTQKGSFHNVECKWCEKFLCDLVKHWVGQNEGSQFDPTPKQGGFSWDENLQDAKENKCAEVTWFLFNCINDHD